MLRTARIASSVGYTAVDAEVEMRSVKSLDEGDVSRVKGVSKGVTSWTRAKAIGIENVNSDKVANLRAYVVCFINILLLGIEAT